MSISDWILLVGIAFLSATASTLFLHRRKGPCRPATGHLRRRGRQEGVYLFDGPALIAQSECGPADSAFQIGCWDDLRLSLADEYPDFPESPDIVRRRGEMVVSPVCGDPGRDILCEWVDGVVRVARCSQASHGAAAQAGAVLADPLRGAMDKVPYPVWILDRTGAVHWCNSAYVNLAVKVRGDAADIRAPLIPMPAGTPPGAKKTRVSIPLGTGRQMLWFDLRVVAEDSFTFCFAQDINAVVDAEVAQRNFVQTLAKTFAQLSIGLAIFDRNQQLALFNPALIDLTSLPADFLSGRPSVSAFFDRLRNQNVMPEPKNYGGWRQQMNELIEAASDGRYHETWSLPSGAVYSVSGRPHPDGAVAFLFEDITAEITLTRRFRAELELGQAVLDGLDDAIVVFASDGALALSNQSYCTLWNVDPEAGFAMVTIMDATRLWQDVCQPTPAWGEIRDFVSSRENRAEWSAQARLRNGDCLNCVVTPIQNGATLIRFTRETGFATIPGPDKAAALNLA